MDNTKFIYSLNNNLIMHKYISGNLSILSRLTFSLVNFQGTQRRQSKVGTRPSKAYYISISAPVPKGTQSLTTRQNKLIFYMSCARKQLATMLSIQNNVGLYYNLMVEKQILLLIICPEINAILISCQCCQQNLYQKMTFILAIKWHHQIHVSH